MDVIKKHEEIIRKLNEVKQKPCKAAGMLPRSGVEAHLTKPPIPLKTAWHDSISSSKPNEEMLKGYRWCRPRAAEKPPIGRMPCRLWLEERWAQNKEAQSRYAHAGHKMPEDWKTEQKIIQAILTVFE